MHNSLGRSFPWRSPMCALCLLCVALLLIPTAFAGGANAPSLPEETPQPEGMFLTSTAIVDGVLGDAYGKFGTQKKGSVPTLSPPLALFNPPEGTVSYVIAMIDPDGGNWVHWLAANVVWPEDGLLPDNASIDLADTLLQGKNSFGKIGYGGPTPPSGIHGYQFTIYALDATLELKKGFSIKQLNKAMEGHVLAEATLLGDYRSKK